MQYPGRPLISARKIAARIKALAQDLNAHYGPDPFTVVALMNGSIFFLVDLVRHLPPHLKIECWSVTSYEGKRSSGKLSGLPKLDRRHQGQRVLVLDDIYDTGLTMNRVTDHLRQDGAAEIKTCVLLRKNLGFARQGHPDWVGFEIENQFVIGYGLDLDQAYRALPMIRILES